MSASAPAGNASSITGMLSAASTSATIEGDDDSSVMSQPAPTSCIQPPTLETMVAIQRLRNSPFCRGLHAEAAEEGGGDPGDSMGAEDVMSGLQRSPCRLRNNGSPTLRTAVG